MVAVEIRVVGGEWQEIEREVAKHLLQRSDFIFSYDIIKTSSASVELLDLAIPAFLGAPPRFGKLLPEVRDPNRLRAIGVALRRIPTGTELWDWPDSRRNRDALLRLFSATRFSSYGVAQFTKMLHLKRPLVIPIIDDLTRRAWTIPYRRRWEISDLVDLVFDMRIELGRRLEGLDSLREIAIELGYPWSRLSRLRLYDVVAYKLMNRDSTV